MLHPQDMGSRRDDGQVTVEYVGVLLLVGAIIVTVMQLGIGSQTSSGVEAEVQRVADDPDALDGILIRTPPVPDLSGPIDVDGPVPLTQVGGITVHTSIADRLQAMLQAARADGVILTGGGYRSPESQIALRRAHCGTSYYAVYQMPASQCTPPTAPPGSSMHERGLAIDFHNCDSHSTACYQWLAANAAQYGFYNLPSEPWHWSVNGR